ncbi:hypothetical protein BCR35DRAFT_302901 [Leucosporidium creatinivorum]|uniref:Uncharacterized protein n=1 Tax=Leucosporidium creatinivorum TaxID=106004 RepID=A0A1Y2FN55_9BASI|nr:hypothetical protein BCR35DRAFT_302901 [Leucosporidium creatinivorum]
MPKAAPSKIPRPVAATKPAPQRHDEETIIQVKVLDLKGKTVGQISKETGVPTSSVQRFLNEHKPDPRQSVAAREKQIAQHERLLGIAVKRLADESKGKGKGNASASSSRASTSKSAPLPVAQRVATTGSTSRASPYASKTSAIPTRPTRAAASPSQPAASSSKTSARNSTAESRSKAVAEKEKATPSGSKSRGSPYAKPVKADSKPASKIEKPSGPSSSRRRSAPVIEVRVTKGPRSSLSKATSNGPFSSKSTSTASPARPLASGSRGVIVPKSSPSSVAQAAASTHRRAHSTTPLPLPAGLVESLPPMDVSPKGKGKEKAVSPEPEIEDEEEQEREQEQEQEETKPDSVESVTTEVDLVSQAVVDDALAAEEEPAPEVDDAAYPSPPIEVESEEEVPVEEEVVEEEDVAMAEPSTEVVDEIPAVEPIQEELLIDEEPVLDDTLGDLEDDEEVEDVAVSSMLVEETPIAEQPLDVVAEVSIAKDASLEETTGQETTVEATVTEETPVAEETAIEQTTILEPSEPSEQPEQPEQPEDTDMSAPDSTEIMEDYVADVAAAMEEAVHDLEAASGMETDVIGGELARLEESVPELEVEVEQEIEVVVEDLPAESMPVLEEDQEKEEMALIIDENGEERVEVNGDLQMDEAEGAQDDEDATTLIEELSTAPSIKPQAQETETPSTEASSSTVKWPVAYPLTIGQEHISAAASLPEPYSSLFGRHIWPVLSNA